jgi:hypothetical protein
MSRSQKRDVSWQDVSDALPLVRSPLLLEVVIGFQRPSGRTVSVQVRLLYRTMMGTHLEFKRWGRLVVPTTPQGVQMAALMAAYDALDYCKGKSQEDLEDLIRWQLSVPK